MHKYYSGICCIQAIAEEKPKEVDLRERILARDEVAVRVALRRGTTCTTFAEGCTPLMYAILLADIAIVSTFVYSFVSY